MAGIPPLMSAIVRSMHNLDARQKVIAENIANSETPHFRAREVTPPDFGDLIARQQGNAAVARVARPQVVVSSAMVALGATRPRDRNIVEDRKTSETKSDGNNVSLEDQLLKMGEVRTDFSAMTNLYKKQISLLNTALGRSG